ncbi:hypothetical protein AAVH_25480 [Aphelenchoides avenae]|nr:hypothetical protein AAVH_25480 [Aphelenchus avenae]
MASWPAASSFLTEATLHINIDHNAEAPVSFELRYFIDRKYWEVGGPILFYCGGGENLKEDARNMVFYTVPF